MMSKEDRRCTVIFIGRRYEMLFWAIKEKPPGTLVWRRGSRGRFQEDEVSRQARGVKMWFCCKLGDRLRGDLKPKST